MKCDICETEMALAFRNRLLQKYDVQYFLCSNCDFLCTEKPYWLTESYSDAIVASDTGLMERNGGVAPRLAMLLYLVLGVRRDAPWLDAAGGYGILTRLMRDIGFNFFWNDRYAQNLVARGFEMIGDGHCEGVTAIEAIEHVESPKSFVREAVGTAEADFFVFTTVLYEGPSVPDTNWWYYGRNTGQHISFFTERTLKILAQQVGMTYYPCHMLHVFSKKPLSSIKLKLVTGKISRLALPLIRRCLGTRIGADFDAMIGHARSPDRL